jgi:hypothetical protein
MRNSNLDVGVLSVRLSSIRLMHRAAKFVFELSLTLPLLKQTFLNQLVRSVPFHILKALSINNLSP